MHRLPLILFAVLVIVFAFMLRFRAEVVDPSQRVDDAFPAITVSALEGGKAWDAAALKGRVTIINFYASWCSPCAAEMPELAALKEQFPSVKIAGIAWNDKPQKLKAWLKQYGNPFDSLWLDPKGDATIDLGIRGIPETFIIDTHGRVRYRLAAAITPSLREETIAPLIQSLLDEASHGD